MFSVGTGNLLEADAEALVNTVNTVGVAGKGIALQFRQAFPENFKDYQRACKRGEVLPGKMFVHQTGQFEGARYIVNFPTKRHWRGKSRIEDVESGLVDLVDVIRKFEITSIAIPPLGCGNGGLNWRDVKPLIESAFADIPSVHVIVFEPSGSPANEDMIVRTERPRLTDNRAAVLSLFARYLVPDYSLSSLEAQKLAYFLQVCGQPLKLNFKKGQYGPYAENLNHALQALEGHYIKGYGDRSRGMEIRPVDASLDEVDRFLTKLPEVRAYVESASEVIAGFESPYSLELLSTVHWASCAVQTDDLDSIHEYVVAWTPRKGELFTRAHVGIAMRHLSEKGLLGTRREQQHASDQ